MCALFLSNSAYFFLSYEEQMVVYPLIISFIFAYNHFFLAGLQLSFSTKYSFLVIKPYLEFDK